MTTRTLGQRASFWVSAGVVGHTLWTSAAPAMVYPVYAAEWHLTHTVTTAIFAIYPIVVVSVLVAFGDVSDTIGRRATMLLGLVASLLGVLLFAVAPNVIWLFVGRTLTGVGVGLSAGPSTAAVLEFSAAGESNRASSITTAAQAVGFSLALLIGGGLVEYAPLPTYLSFWVLFIVLATLFAATWFLPRHTVESPSRRWRFRMPSIPPGFRKTFAISSTAVTTAYVHGVMILSLGAQVAHDLVGSANALTNGAALSLFPISFGVVGIVAKSLPSRAAMTLGALSSAVGLGLLVVSVSQHQLVIFLTSTAISGMGYSLLFLGGLAEINARAPAQQRGGILSALYLFAYLALGTVAIVLGVIATKWGLGLAIKLGAGAIALLSGVTILFSALGSLKAPAEDEASAQCNSESPRPSVCL
jgi:hypothetical protein